MKNFNLCTFYASFMHKMKLTYTVTYKKFINTYNLYSSHFNICKLNYTNLVAVNYTKERIGWEYLKTIIVRKHNAFKITPNVGSVGIFVIPLEV